MPDYAIFGGRLRSEIELPELRPHPGGAAVDWSFDVVDRPPLAGEPVLLGEDRLSDELLITLARLPGGFRLTYSDTGAFDIPDGATRIAWHPHPGGDAAVAGLIAIGYAFSTLFHAAGVLCLHGSAVGTETGAIAFVAPKGFGKSTLAQALLAAGAPLATDDAIVVTPGSPPMLRPGVHQVRLWDDSADRLVDDSFASHLGYAAKHVVTHLPDERLVLRPMPLAAVYVLAPMLSNHSGAAVERDMLAPLAAALSLVSNTKGGHLLGGAEAGKVLDRAVEIAAQVPVYRLRLVRDFDRLDEAIDRILGWHGGVPALGRAQSLAGSAG